MVTLLDIRTAQSLLRGIAVRTPLLEWTGITADPELARVGMNEREAKAKGVDYRLLKVPMTADLRTRTLSETRGFMKALIDDNDRVLGFTVFGFGGGEIAGLELGSGELVEDAANDHGVFAGARRVLDAFPAGARRERVDRKALRQSQDDLRRVRVCLLGRDREAVELQLARQ